MSFPFPNAHFSNVRKLFRTDPAYCVCDSDLAQADARVVAADAGAKKLLALFDDPDVDVHSENGYTIFGDYSDHSRQMAKRGVHATNYLISTPALAIALGCSRAAAQAFKDAWFTAHPEIYDWHQRIQLQLETDRTITNAFGYRRVYFDRIDKIASEAVAWIPQSTVARVTNLAAQNLRALRDRVGYNAIIINLQNHDSLVYQVQRRRMVELLPEIRQCFNVPIPYETPLVIPAGLAVSSLSWGGVKDMSWDRKYTNLRTAHLVRKGVIL